MRPSNFWFAWFKPVPVLGHGFPVSRQNTLNLVGAQGLPPSSNFSGPEERRFTVGPGILEAIFAFLLLEPVEAAEFDRALDTRGVFR